MLGINDRSKRSPVPYRNYAAVNDGDKHYAEMAAAGFVKKSGRTAGGEYQLYRTTEEGFRLAVESYKTIRLPKSKRMYLRFLSVADACPDISFKDFLTHPDFAQIRRDA